MKTFALILLMVTVASVCCAEDRAFWMSEGQNALRRALELRPNFGVAKNVILFLGDGMSMPTITAARILKGQLNGGTGEEYRLQMEKFPYAGLCKTYNTNQQTPDSAGTSTALHSGVKTRAGVLGVDQRVVKGNCSMMPEAALETIIDWALREGKSAGLVTTSRVTHATPGGSYAKIPHRDWENDMEMKDVKDCDHVKDIARQLVEDNHRLHVALGGGWENFLPNTTKDGLRQDGRDLIQEWKNTQKAKGKKYEYVNTKDQLKAVPSDTDHLFGMFTKSHMNYDADRTSDEPSITDMFLKAHEVLSKNDKGYYLLVEGGRIDHAHHVNLAHQALLDTIAFDKAIETAVNVTSEADTLILATADHSHTMSMAGYPVRGHNIVDKMTYKKYPPKSKEPLDHFPMTVLLYANGPGPQRTDLTTVDTTDKNFVFPNGIPTRTETHGGEDVAVFARGPMSHLIGGVQEQNVLAHVMGYASCIGSDKSHCDKAKVTQLKKHSPHSGVAMTSSSLCLTLLVALTPVIIALVVDWC